MPNDSHRSGRLIYDSEGTVISGVAVIMATETAEENTTARSYARVQERRSEENEIRSVHDDPP
jgi:hypothetical protein